MGANQLRIGVIGFGYWGPNLARNFTANAGTEVTVIADEVEARRTAARNLYPRARIVESSDQVVGASDVDAVAVATPLFTHHPIARSALEAGKHVLVEKPLAASAAECEQLQDLAAAKKLAVMVDHTFVYTGAVRKIRELVAAGHLGRVLYFDSVRINLGLFQPEFNVVWDLAPHDISIIDYVLGREARWVSAIGAKHYGKHENLAYLTIGYDEGLLAHVHCNWVAPVKTRRITIAGTDRMLVYDDTQPAERVKVYDSGVNVEHLGDEEAHRMNVQYRTGEVVIPKLDPSEALRLVAGAFETMCRTGEPSPSDVSAGLRVVRILEAAQQSIDSDGKRIGL